jgi:hypothetical protein
LALPAIGINGKVCGLASFELIARDVLDDSLDLNRDLAGATDDELDVSKTMRASAVTAMPINAACGRPSSDVVASTARR